MPWVSSRTWKKTPWKAKRHYAALYGRSGIYSVCGVGPMIAVGPEWHNGDICCNCAQIAAKREIEEEAPIVKMNQAIAKMNRANNRPRIDWVGYGLLVGGIVFLITVLILMKTK